MTLTPGEMLQLLKDVPEEDRPRVAGYVHDGCEMLTAKFVLRLKGLATRIKERMEANPANRDDLAGQVNGLRKFMVEVCEMVD